MTKLKPIPDGRLLSVPQAAQFLSCGKTKIYSLHRQGKIELIKLGSSTRITERSLHKLIDELPRMKGEK